MGFSSDQIVQIGLNFAGFVTAGLLTAVIYSLWTERRQATRAALSRTAPLNLPKMPANGPTPEKKPDVEFINLKENATRPRRSHRSTASAPADGHKTRDRQEIIRLAKEMLAERKTSAEIRKTLKVTDGELSFLKQNMNLQGIVRNS